MKLKHGGLWVAFAVLVLAAVAVLALTVVVNFSQEIPALNPASAATAASGDSSDTDAEPDAEEINKEYDGVTLVEGSGSSASADAESTEGDDDYLCSASNSRKLTESDIEELLALDVTGLPAGKSILRMVVNEMYARYGYKFETESIQEYFNGKTWYSGLKKYTDNMDKVYKKMSKIEKKNIEFLTEQIEELGLED
ncbi:MAG: YARHG domain-containing protein [Eubacterium sp.]|nr:YARHG domain-containing protein [Eubacterium sp.]